jgi:hypothetical protein
MLFGKKIIPAHHEKPLLTGCNWLVSYGQKTIWSPPPCAGKGRLGCTGSRGQYHFVNLIKSLIWSRNSPLSKRIIWSQSHPKFAKVAIQIFITNAWQTLHNVSNWLIYWIY